MRPEEQLNGMKLHECAACRKRVEDPDTRVCDSCGGTLVNISRDRDL